MPLPLNEVKMAIGFSLESAIINNIDIHDLECLYENPSELLVKELHDRLLDSRKHRERVAAIWLQMGFDQGPLKNNPSNLITDMTELEVLLSVLIDQSGTAWKDVNNWMNYIANAHEHLLHGYWTDAKVLLSLGLETSLQLSIEKMKTKESLREKVTLYQQATASFFDEMKEYPLKLHIPEKYSDLSIPLQELLLDIMRNHNAEDLEEAKGIRNLIKYLSNALHTLLSSKIDETKKELTSSKNNLKKWKLNVKKKTCQIDSYIKRLEKIVSKI